ncbi:hypothetical protein GLAREA_10582 [Glarea lozoyensis ATCC 20868]|uniref:Uncharacterized protein n=1 Tax=Glarea lozoyensis (strain ATCC 20868 / MF5171) TaxID=1116229 RepID=S3D8V1_GLAL2|nr:uncharacterized protein GLAREA_10582 [Glarea lozoyensis ATCC 20868]EPE34887.1 hypothetical protein GLAREA_10582 [Glarea lozoyensis ATCC 20868]
MKVSDANTSVLPRLELKWRLNDANISSVTKLSKTHSQNQELRQAHTQQLAISSASSTSTSVPPTTQFKASRSHTTESNNRWPAYGVGWKT